MIKTGFRALDKQIKGYRHNINMIYGGGATGKTTLCLMCALELAKKGKKVLFLDSEGSFSVERAKQLCNNFGDVAKNIIVIKVKNFDQQKDLFSKLNKLIIGSNFSVVIMDTISMHYRKEVKEDHYKANREIDREFYILKGIAKKVPVLITNQIYHDLDGNVKSVGGEMLRNWCDYLIELKKNGNRKLIIKKPIEKEFNFDILNIGLVEV